jgi:hypothetical protein
MTKITLASQPWRVHSPSFLQHDTSPLQMAYNGRSWVISIAGVWSVREFSSRHEAALMIGQAFQNAWRECAS